MYLQSGGTGHSISTVFLRTEFINLASEPDKNVHCLRGRFDQNFPQKDMS